MTDSNVNSYFSEGRPYAFFRDVASIKCQDKTMSIKEMALFVSRAILAPSKLAILQKLE
jgi:hypothetical protein